MVERFRGKKRLGLLGKCGTHADERVQLLRVLRKDDLGNGFAVSLHKLVRDMKQTRYAIQDLKHKPAGKTWRRG